MKEEKIEKKEIKKGHKTECKARKSFKDFLKILINREMNELRKMRDC